MISLRPRSATNYFMPPQISNDHIVEILRQIGEYLEMQDIPFKPRAFEKAAQTIENLEEQVSEIYKKGGDAALKEIPGVGTSIANTIVEILKTGRSKDHEDLKKKTPVNLDELSHIEGLGPKSIKRLYQEL